MTTKTHDSGALIERTKAAAAERKAARLAEVVALVRRKMVAAVEDFYDIGAALCEVMDKGLYTAAGHASFEDFLAAEGLMARRQAAKLMAVARKVPREAALRLGHERAYAIAAYADVTPEHESVARLIEADVTIGGKGLFDASLREIEAATREARTKADGDRARGEAARERAREDADLARVMRALLRDAGVGRAGVQVVGDEVRVVLTRAQVERLAGE